jgi:acyl carrier protein
MSKTIEQTIRDYLQSAFLDEGQMIALRGDDDLLMVLDSLQVLRMLLDFEAEYSIQFDPSEFTPENLGSIERMAALLGKKVGEAVC